MGEPRSIKGTETAIENLGADYCDVLVPELRRLGLRELGDSVQTAWRTHPMGTEPDSAGFEDVIAKLHEQIADDATLDAICRYVGGHAELFEQR